MILNLEIIKDGETLYSRDFEELEPVPVYDIDKIIELISTAAKMYHTQKERLRYWQCIQERANEAVKELGK